MDCKNNHLNDKLFGPFWSECIVGLESENDNKPPKDNSKKNCTFVTLNQINPN